MFYSKSLLLQENKAMNNNTVIVLGATRFGSLQKNNFILVTPKSEQQMVNLNRSSGCFYLMRQSENSFVRGAIANLFRWRRSQSHFDCVLLIQCCRLVFRRKVCRPIVLPSFLWEEIGVTRSRFQFSPMPSLPNLGWTAGWHSIRQRILNGQSEFSAASKRILPLWNRILEDTNCDRDPYKCIGQTEQKMKWEPWRRTVYGWSLRAATKPNMHFARDVAVESVIGCVHTCRAMAEVLFP